MKKTFCAFFMILFIAACFAVCGFCAETQVNAFTDKETALVGDIIKFTVKAELPENAYVAAGKNIIFKNFDTLDMRVERVSERPNVYVITFELAAYTAGRQEIEPVGIAYINDSGIKKMFFTPRSDIVITSLLGSGGQDIKDIKPIYGNTISAGRIAAAALIVLLIAFLTVFAVKDSANKKTVQTEEPDPQKEALRRLDELFSSGIIEKGDSRAFYYSAAEILRTYISFKYNFNAMEMTSSELLKKLESAVYITMTRRELKKYLDVLDLARYAGFKASADDMSDSLEKTREFIRKL